MNDTAVDARGKTKNRRIVGLLGGAGALVLALGGVTLAIAPSASASGDIIDGNPTCEDVIPGSTEIKFDPPTPGSKTADGVTVTWTERILGADDPDHPGDQTGGQVVDFTATGGVVLGVLVKGGPAANWYDYRPDGKTADNGLHPPVNSNNDKYYGISHVNFCVKQVTTTPTPTKSPTETQSPTKSPTETQSPTKSPTETQSPTKSPTETQSPSTSPTETQSPSTSPTETQSPSTSPTETQSPSTSPSQSPSDVASDSPSSPVAVPTEVDAGQSGGLRNASAITGRQSALGIGLLMVGGLLVFAGILKSRQNRGQHSA